MTTAPRPVLPSRSGPCPCASGEKFKRCCVDRIGGRDLGQACRVAWQSAHYSLALTECRADVCQYTVWHKSHTVPLLKAGIVEDGTFGVTQSLLDLDIRALSELVGLLQECYAKTGLSKEFPAALERLRTNIDDPRWHRKIVYHGALHALFAYQDVKGARRELRRLGPVRDETDCEILQLYLDLFGDELSFPERLDCTNRILQLSEDTADLVHYGGLKASQYLLIGDESAARHELELAIAEYLKRQPRSSASEMGLHHLANCLQLLGTMTGDSTPVTEAVAIYQDLLSRDMWTSAGRAILLRSLGDAFRHQGNWDKAYSTYASSPSVREALVSQVFMAECLMRLGRLEESRRELQQIAIGDLDPAGYADYAFALASIGIESGDVGLLNDAADRLRNLELPHPYFRERRDRLRFEVLDTLVHGRSATIVARVRQLLRRPFAWILRYGVLQPNVMGLGVDLGKIMQDMAVAGSKHSGSKHSGSTHNSE